MQTTKERRTDVEWGNRTRREREKEKRRGRNEPPGGEDVYVYQSVWTELEKVTN